MTLASMRLEILGTTSDRIGPFALLGLTPERCEPHHVRLALESLLARIDTHPNAADPAADVLRREIRAAAALLLDPVSRRELSADYQNARHGPAPGRTAVAPTRSGASSNGSPRSTSGAPNYPPAFLRDLLAAWVSAGGWNGKARHRIIAAGAQHGVSGEALLDAILTMPVTLATPRDTPLVGPPPTGLPGGFDAAPALNVSDVLSHRDAHEAAKRNLFAAMLAFLACAAIVIPFAAWVIFQINVMGPKPDPSLTNASPAPVAPLKESTTPLLPTVPREELSLPVSPMSQTFAGVLERLDRDSAVATELDQAVLNLFASASTQGRRQWMQFDAGARERLRDVLVSCLYRLGRDETSAKSLVDLIDPDQPRWMTTEGITGRAWSVGMLAVMMREPDLPAPARSVIEQHWHQHVPTGSPPRSGDFDGAARFALREMISPLVGTVTSEAAAVELWIAWLQCVSTVSDKDQAEALALESARQVLIEGPDISASDRAGRVIAALFSVVRWKTSAAARGALLAWWDEPRVSASDLAVVSSWIVSTGAIPGLDDSFIVPTNAGAEARAALRQKLAEAWTSAGAATGNAPARTEVADWILRADRLLADPVRSSPEELLVQTIAVAFQNTAASMIWAARPEDAATLLADAEARIAAARLTTAPPPGGATPPVGGDGDWAVLYFRASKENDREGAKRLVETISQDILGDLGPINAAVLADVALNGQPREIRPVALETIAGSYASGPNVLLALADKMIPDRSDIGLSDAIERITGVDLPDPRQEDWYTRARLALLQHVASLRGALSANASIDSLAKLLAGVYGDRLAHQSGTQTDPAEAARLAFEQWVEIGRPMQPIAPLPAPLHQILHRAAIRAAVLDDPIGRFHAWQIASLEAASYVTAAERPGARQELSDLLDSTTLRLAVSRNAMEQLLVAERALTKVWEIRFGQAARGGDF